MKLCSMRCSPRTKSAMKSSGFIGALMALLARAGHAMPDQFENLDVLTPFGAIYRYEDYDAVVSLNRHAARASVRELRTFVEAKLRERTGR